LQMRKVAFNLYLVFFVSWFLHLAARYPVLGSLRLDLLLVCAIAALALLDGDREAVAGGDPRVRFLVGALAVYSALSIPFVEWPGSVLRQGFPNFLKALVFYVFTTQLVSDRQRLKRLIVVFVGCQSFRIAEPMYLHLTLGYWGSSATMAGWETMNRLSGAPFDIINPNGLAFVILTALPFWHYLTSGSVLGRLAYLAFLPVALYALLLTGSRTGALALGAVVLVVWMTSQRKVAFAVGIVVLALLATPYLSADLADRYLSIVVADTRNAQTASDRIEGVSADFRVALRRPLFGHGLGTSREANANFGNKDMLAHNLYAEVAQELGFLGLAIVVQLIVAIAWSLKRVLTILRTKGGDPLLSGLAAAMRTWLAMNFVFSFASYGLSSYEWYLLAGLADVVARLASDANRYRPSAGPSVGALPATAPV
jgi:putative inorganic carbon (hco3(-)) transporter